MKLIAFLQDWIIATLKDRVQRAKIAGTVFGLMAFLANIDYAKQLIEFFPPAWSPYVTLVSGFCSAITFVYAHVISPPTLAAPSTQTPPNTPEN